MRLQKAKSFLGIIFDDNLSWKERICYISSKLNSCLGATRKVRSYLNISALLTIYHSLMQSRLQYCCETWGSWEPRGNKVILQRLQAVCNKFIRLMYNLDRQDSVRAILKNKNLLNVKQMYNYTVGNTMQRANEGSLPEPLQNLFESDPAQNNSFILKTSRIKRTEKSIAQSGPRIWNSFPSQLHLVRDNKKFKTMLKKHVIASNN